MPFGFKAQTNIQVYGDGEGNIVIEEWKTDNLDDPSQMLGRVVIDSERFEFIALHHSELRLEASGVKP